MYEMEKMAKFKVCQAGMNTRGKEIKTLDECECYLTYGVKPLEIFESM